MQSKIQHFVLFASLLFGLTFLLPAQNGNTSTIVIKQLPPEAFPSGSCSESEVGFLGVIEAGQKERTKLSAEEIGRYVSKRLSEGYSVTLHPQVSGRIYAIADCHSTKP